MGAGRRRLKLVRILLWVVLVLVAVIAAMPVWFPWVLRPVAKRFGAGFAQYHRQGYHRFELTDVTFTNKSGRFEAQRLEGFVPTAWFYRQFAGSREQPFLEVNSWVYTSATNRAPVKRSTYERHQKTEKVFTRLHQWIPRAGLTNGTLRIKGQTWKFPDGLWNAGVLSANAILPNNDRAHVVLSTAAKPWTLEFESIDLELQTKLSIHEQPDGVSVDGTALWISNRLDITAAFGVTGRLPATASLNAPAFEVPATRLKLDQYRNLTGALRAEWSSNRYLLDLTARAFPAAGGLPPIDLALRGWGDTNSAHIDLARISAPWLQAELSGQTEIFFKPPFLSQPAAIDLAGDLAQQPWIPAQGKLTGNAILRPGIERFPQVSFALSGTDVAATNFAATNLAIRTLHLEGDFVWPRLGLTTLQLQTADGSDLSLAGNFDVQQKAIRDGRVTFSGGFGRQFLPKIISYETATLSGRFEGPLPSLTNDVTLKVEGLAVPQVQPMQLEARWTGRSLNLQPLRIALHAGATSVRLEAATDFSGGPKRITVTGMELVQSNRTELRLDQPCEFTFRKREGTNVWSAGVQTLRLVGENRELEFAAALDWPERGAFRSLGKGLDTGLLSDFVSITNSEGRLRSLTLTGGWTNGPVAFELAADAEIATKENLLFSAQAHVAGGERGIVINRLWVQSATQMVCHAQGSLPIVAEPGHPERIVRIDPNEPLRFNLFTEPDSLLWEKVAEATGLLLQEPNLRADLEGTWAAPQGRVVMQVKRAEFLRAKRAMPSIENIDVLIELDREAARLARFRLSAAGQQLSAAGEIPLGESYWPGFKRHKGLPDWRQGTGRLEVENAQISAFAPFLPELVSPEGIVDVDVALEAGGRLRGELSLKEARTRPLGTLGPVRGIEGRIYFSGRNVVLSNIWAEIGGQRITVEGGALLPENLRFTNSLPQFHVLLRGTNVPLVRSPKVLLRSDFKLAATNPPSGPGVLSGDVRLRDGLFLADLQSLVSERATTPENRPPYFSVDVDPWSHWHLRLNVQGDSFLRVQTPLFRGTVSSFLKLEGTLGNPIALGEVQIDSGRVTFPFGSLDVTHGFVLLTSENPYRPQLFVTARAERYGHDVKMEATGPADQPLVQFSSTPPLSSEQIVLMLTTGQVPQSTGATGNTQRRAQGLALFVGRNLLSEFGLGGSGEDRLTIRSGEQISESGRSTYELEYKLTDRWFVTGEYDRFDQYNLNMKWRVYQK